MLAFFLATQITSPSYAPPAPVWHRSGRLVSSPVSAQFSGAIVLGEVPPYALAQRNLAASQLSLAWRPAPSVQIAARWGVYGAWWPDGTQVIGPGDLHFSTQARLVKSEGRAPDLWLAWELKLPNAEQPLGTNETDTQVLLWARESQGPWAAELGSGIWIAGHPDQLAAQDDALLVLARVSRATGPGFALLNSDLRLRSARNPTAAQMGVGWEQPLGERVHLGASVDLGLSAAAPDQAFRLWVALVPDSPGA
ncbi:MAG: hypothetical protein ACI9VR_000085 [Cognaticolwellia sp.]